MTNELSLINKTEKMIDEIKSLCAEYGLSGTPGEYKIIIEMFLYKYLNDKFLFVVREKSKDLSNTDSLSDVEEYLNRIDNIEYSKLLIKLGPNVAKFRKEYLASYLFNNQNSKLPEFYELFDNALEGISNDNIDIFSVKNGSNDTVKLFEKLSQLVPESNQKNNFFKAIISQLVEFSFESAFYEDYDFFSTIFEYMIKDYNKDSGKYAEYYTPNSIARIISRILVPNGDQNVTVYDPAAGSGTLILALAHQIGENKCTIYTQDISQKSSELLRLNLILNNLVHSLDNVIQGNTLLKPYFMNDKKDELMKFDYIISNPPFNVDFSKYRDQLLDTKYKSRFFAGIPTIPDKDKKSMLIYLPFIQHIIYSMKDNGKAAIVVPTPFLTKSKSIEKKIRKKLIDDKMLKGVISMPLNVFATTGTNVSVLLLEKGNTDNNVFFIDATQLGTKSSTDSGTQKTILMSKDQDKIVDTYNGKIEEDNFSTIASYEKIIGEDYRLSPSSYFNHELDYKKYDATEYIDSIKNNCKKLKLYYSNEIEKILSNLFNYWFVQFEFPTENGRYKSSGGKMVYNEKLNIDIPEGWKVEIINKVCDVVDCLHSKKPDYCYENENYYLLQSENLELSGRISAEKKYYISKEDYDVWSRKIEIHENDFVIANAGRSGAMGMVPKNVKCAIGRNMTAVRCNTISPYYFRQFLYSPYMNKFVASNLDEGSFFKSFNVKSIKKIYVLVPDDKVMKKYLEIVEPLIKQILNGIDIPKEIFDINNI